MFDEAASKQVCLGYPAWNLCRYVLRPAFSQERLERLPDDRIRYSFRKPRSNGATSVTLQPLEFMEKLAALVPPPSAHLVIYHGLLGPRNRLRSRVVPKSVPPEETCAHDPAPVLPPKQEQVQRRLSTPEPAPEAPVRPPTLLGPAPDGEPVFTRGTLAEPIPPAHGLGDAAEANLRSRRAAMPGLPRAHEANRDDRGAGGDPPHPRLDEPADLIPTRRPGAPAERSWQL